MNKIKKNSPLIIFGEDLERYATQNTLNLDVRPFAFRMTWSQEPTLLYAMLRMTKMPEQLLGRNGVLQERPGS